MWVIPRNLKYSLRHGQAFLTQTEASCMSKSFLVRSTSEPEKTWNLKLKRQGFISFLRCRLLDDAKVSVHRNKTLLQSSDLKFFHIFLEMNLKAWEHWVSNRRAEFGLRANAKAPQKWATPNTMDTLPPRSPEALHKHLTIGARAGRKSSGNLREQIVQYPLWVGDQTRLTPVVGDAHLTLTKELEPQKDGKTRINTFLRQVCAQESYRGYLNPRWVECLMGLPIGWVNPFCGDSFFQSQAPLEFQETNWPTPPASQRGDDLVVYLRRSHKRVKSGDAPFAIPLQNAVEAAQLGVDIQGIWDEACRTEDTEAFIQRILQNKQTSHNVLADDDDDDDNDNQ
jgi:hypothetical protein